MLCLWLSIWIKYILHMSSGMAHSTAWLTRALLPDSCRAHAPIPLHKRYGCIQCEPCLYSVSLAPTWYYIIVWETCLYGVRFPLHEAEDQVSETMHQWVWAHLETSVSAVLSVGEFVEVHGLHPCQMHGYKELVHHTCMEAKSGVSTHTCIRV